MNPKFPNISLAEAISRAKMIYEAEHMSAMTPTVAAEAMGYKGISGASLKVISSLKKYGLLEGRNDQVKLTKDAQVIAIDEPSSLDYQAAMARSALRPEVYLELHNQFSAGGSERNMAVYLEKQGFKPDAAALVARNYKESLGLIGAKTGPVEIENAFEMPIDSPEPSTPRHPVLRAEPARHVVSATALPMRSETIGTATAPFRIVMNGNKLHIEADVDLKGLQLFKQMLNGYEMMLKLLETDMSNVPEVREPSDD